MTRVGANALSISRHIWRIAMNTEVLRRAFRGEPFSTGDAAAVLGIHDISSTLSRLKAAGVLERIGRGRYRFASLDKWQAMDGLLAREQVRSTRSDRLDTLSRLARDRFRSWLDTGYLTRTGERQYRVRIRPRSGGLSVRRL
jgi:hypothetical protein